MILLQTAKCAKIHSAAVAATADGHHTGREGEKKIKLHTHSYCCLDYAQVLLLAIILVFNFNLMSAFYFTSFS